MNQLTKRMMNYFESPSFALVLVIFKILVVDISKKWSRGGFDGGVEVRNCVFITHVEPPSHSLQQHPLSNKFSTYIFVLNGLKHMKIYFLVCDFKHSAPKK